MPKSPLRIAIVGAGLAGLTCARNLTQHHRFQVTVFEKSRGVGGRSATRRHDSHLHFDHGAQYFTTRDVRFQSQVEQWIRSGVAARWTGQIVSLDRGHVTAGNGETVRFVGVPGMSSIARDLAANLTIQQSSQIQRLERDGKTWHLWDDQGRDCGHHDLVISTAPPIQTRELYEPYSSQLAKQLESVEMLPCWAVLLQLPERLDVSWDGAFVQNSPLAWVARNSSKPGRSPKPDTWVLHASPEWSNEHLEQAPETVWPELWRAFHQALRTPRELAEPAFVVAHRWRYALPREALPKPFLHDPQHQLAVAGDWCGGPRIEGAFLSGLELAAHCVLELASGS